MSKEIIKTDRVTEPVKETPKVDPSTPEMKVEQGGAGTLSQKQLITTLVVIVVIIVVVILAVYLYKKYQKSPLTTPQ